MDEGAQGPALQGTPHFASLYVGDIHKDVTEAMLYEIFNAVGPVASIRVCRHNVTRKSLGYAYVNFHSVGDAQRALETLNYSSIKGRSCRIMWGQHGPSLRKESSSNIYVKNLDRTIDNKALYDTFSLFGSILSCKVASDSEGNSYGYGFIHYETEDAALHAIERVNGMQIGEKTVQVCHFVKREDRPLVVKYTNLYIKGFPDEWSQERIVEEMSQFGTIKASALKIDSKGRRMAFVDFENTEDAQKCVAEMHMKDIRDAEALAKAKEEGKEDEPGPDGHPVGRLFVSRVVPRQERDRERRERADVKRGANLYVKNLDQSTDDTKLRELFEPFGTVTSVSAPRDESGRSSRGYGFVCFNTPAEATAAVTGMHLKAVNGKPLYVGLAEKREVRQERLRSQYEQRQKNGLGKGGFGFDAGNGLDSGKGGGGDADFGLGATATPGCPMPHAPGKGPPPMDMMGNAGPQMMGPMGEPTMGKGVPPMMGPMGPMGMMPPAAMMSMMQPMMPGMGMMQAGMGMLGAGMMPGSMVQPMGMPAGAPMGWPTPLRPSSRSAALASAPPAKQKQMIGEMLHTAISRFQPKLAGKITGMMLEMENIELLMILASEQQLRSKVEEALDVLSKARLAK